MHPSPPLQVSAAPLTPSALLHCRHANANATLSGLCSEHVTTLLSLTAEHCCSPATWYLLVPLVLRLLLVPLVLLVPLAQLFPQILLEPPALLGSTLLTGPCPSFLHRCALRARVFVRLWSRRAFCTLNHFSHSRWMCLHVWKWCQIHACILKRGNEIFTVVSVNIFLPQSWLNWTGTLCLRGTFCC